MSVILKNEIIHLEGQCRVEDAEPLLNLLLEGGNRTVDITGADHLHAAVAQVLLVFRPTVAGPARDRFLRTWVEPLLTSSAHS